MSSQPSSEVPPHRQGNLTLLERLIDRMTINVDFSPHKILYAVAALIGALSAASVASDALSGSKESAQAEIPHSP